MTNHGPSDATSVSFSEAIPANTTLTSLVTPAGWACTSGGGTGTLECTVPDLPPGTYVFTVVVTVNAGVANGTVISDTVKISSAVPDPNGANNSATANTIVGTTAQAD